MKINRPETLFGLLALIILITGLLFIIQAPSFGQAIVEFPLWVFVVSFLFSLVFSFIYKTQKKLNNNLGHLHFWLTAISFFPIVLLCLFNAKMLSFGRHGQINTFTDFLDFVHWVSYLLYSCGTVFVISLVVFFVNWIKNSSKSINL